MEDILKKDLENLRKMFPNGVNENEYKNILHLFYEEYSDRNLAELISNFTNKPYAQVYNDILRVAQYNSSNNDIDDIKNK